MGVSGPGNSLDDVRDSVPVFRMAQGSCRAPSVCRHTQALCQQEAAGDLLADCRGSTEFGSILWDRHNNKEPSGIILVILGTNQALFKHSIVEVEP